MGKRSTFTGYLRQRGATSSSSSRLTEAPSIAVVPAVLHFQIPLDFGLAAGNLSGKWLPQGARVLRAEVVISGIAGATTPALDIGLEFAALGDDNALVDTMTITASNTAQMGAFDGVWLGEVLTEDVEITYTDNSGVQATAGTADIFLTYTFDDDGSTNN